MNIVTWVGLIAMFVGFGMLGVGAESKDEGKKTQILAYGFGVFMVSVVLLGYVVLSNTLSAS
jgi:hypothetical protein